MSQWSTLFSFVTNSANPSQDLSAFFETPDVAETFRENKSWRLLETSHSSTYWGGTNSVGANGELGQGGAPASFVFVSAYPYDGHMELQVEYEPEPTAQCDGGCSSDPSGTMTCPSGVSTGTGSVQLPSGRFIHNIPLLSINALGNGGWQMGLDYYANFGLDGLLGKNFNFPQSAQLIELGFSGGYEGPFTVGFRNVELLTSQNTRETFINTATNQYSSEGNNTAAILTRGGAGVDDEFALIASNGTVSKFFGFNDLIATPGRLKSIADRYGNEQTYTWINTGGIDQLITVTDSYGRAIQYRYHGVEAGYRLKEIEDFLGRKLNFQFDNQGHLVAAVTPSILQAAPGNEFPGGTGYVFEYDVENPQPERRDDLLKIWYPNEVAPHLDTATRTVNVAAVYANATPRYVVEYGQDYGDLNTWGRVLAETVGDPDSGIGGTSTFAYTTTVLPANLINPADPIVFRCTMTDRNGNITIHDFNAAQMEVRNETQRNRDKINIPDPVDFPNYVTWTKYNTHNRPVEIVYPAGNTVEYEYDSGAVAGIGTYPRRTGLLLRTARKPGNTLSLPSRSGSNGQDLLTQRYFYDPLFNQQCAVIEERGNPINNSGAYFVPQNGGTTPTNADRSRYATIQYFDYQKNTDTTITTDLALQALLFPGIASGTAATYIQYLLNSVNSQMQATDGSGGLPAGFQRNLGDINGDGTGNGNSSGLPVAPHAGKIVKTKRPSVRLIGVESITTQVREELFTVNARGQTTTHTDPEGNLTVYVRYPGNDPEGDGQFIAAGISGKQYGRLREVHVDADPNDVLSLIGTDGDLVDFIPGKIVRSNTPGVYQDLITRYEGSRIGSGCGCSACAYDPLGNPLAVTDPRGFTTNYDRNELGEVYRTISPTPYRYRVETYFDANRNIIRSDVEDKWVLYKSDDPTSACFAQFVPSGSGSTAHVPTRPGFGGSIRPGWFVNRKMYDLLDSSIQDDVDATGSSPDRLVTHMEYDANQNLVKVIKPESNIVEFDYDERNLRIAQRVGKDADAEEDGALTITAYDANGNPFVVVGAAQRGGSGNQTTATVGNAFGTTTSLVHTGDFVLENTLDGFDRSIRSIDAAGNVTSREGTLGNPLLDPQGRVIGEIVQGPVGGATPTDRDGTNNVDLTRSFTRYDEAGRTYEDQQDVFVASGTELSSSRDITHTGGGLKANSNDNDHTVSVTVVEDGTATENQSYILNRTVCDRTGRSVAIITDNTGLAVHEYDGANRSIKITDAAGNVIERQYDAAGNVTRITSREKCTLTQPIVADEVVVSAIYYDSLNRPVVTANQGASGKFDFHFIPCDSNANWRIDSDSLLTRYGYDSRNNRTLVIDPKGNTAITVFDGASRITQTQRHLRQRGQGTESPAANQTFLPFNKGSITTTTVFDANGRTSQLIDDRGAATTFRYDTLDRQITMVFQDGSTRSQVFNPAGDAVRSTDENGSIFENTFDALGRKTVVNITRASGVIGTTAQAFQFDGLSRTTLARDTANGSNADVALFYDSLSRSLEDAQTFAGNTRNVTYHAFTSNSPTGFTFPNDRKITSDYDILYRRTLVEETDGGADIATWEFFGPTRVAEQTLGNGLIMTHLNNARNRSAVQAGQDQPSWGDASSDRLGYDGAGRPITKRYLAGGIDGMSHAYSNAAVVVGFTTAYDSAANKFYERALHAESRSHLYEPFVDGSPLGGYDSINRLRQYQRGVLSPTAGFANRGGGSIVTPISLPNTNEHRTYDLDGLGNWRRTSYEPVGAGEQTEIRQYNGLNQITRTDHDEDQVNVTYDGTPGASNGNLQNDGVRVYEWDALNRLVNVFKTPDSPVPIGEYVYDALSRRIRKTVSNSGISGTIPNGVTDLIYNPQWQCVEERDGSNTPAKQSVWGGYIDELVQLKTFVAINGNAAGNYYPLSDSLYRTTALTNASGSIVEAYDSDVYGNTLVITAAGTGGNWWANDATQGSYPTCETIFTGRRFDSETKLYDFRARYFDPVLGRFIGRDPIGYVDGMGLYAAYFVPSSVDPFGLQSAPGLGVATASLPIVIETPTGDISQTGFYNRDNICTLVSPYTSEGDNSRWLRRPDVNLIGTGDSTRELLQQITRCKGMKNGRCVSTLNISGHGSGSFGVTLGIDPKNGGIATGSFNPERLTDEQIATITESMCHNGTFVLQSCGGINRDKLAKFAAKLNRRVCMCPENSMSPNICSKTWLCAEPDQTPPLISPFDERMM